jgi:putative inorganic carbon (hco3(-)) transporter
VGLSLRGILLAAWIFPSLPICLLRPFYGIVLWTIISFTSIQWYTYSAREVPWALVVAIPTLIGSVLFGRNWRSVFSLEALLLVGLWLWFTVTTIISVSTPALADHADSTWLRWAFVSKVLLMTLVAVAVVDSFERLRTLVLVIAACFGFFVVKCLPFLVLHGGADRVYGPEKSMIADNNDFGLALNMTLPLFFFLAQSESNPRLKRLFWALSLATIPAIFFTYSRGALLGLIVVSGLMFLHMKQRSILVPLLIVGVLIAVIFAPESWRHRMDPTRKDAVDGSAYSRINAWTFSWRLACEYPLTGGGFDTFTKGLFILYAPNPLDVHGPHSIYFGVLAEHGFIGLFLYLLMIGACVVSVRRVLRWARLCGDEVAAHYANMFCVSLAGFLISGFFLGRQYFDYFFTVIACMIAFKRVCLLRWTDRVAEEPVLEEAVA